MNKQIEEMAKICCQMCKHEGIGRCFAVGKDGLELGWCLIVRLTAEKLYNAGYRKQSENMVEVVRCKDCAHFQMVNSRAMCSLNAKKEGVLWLGLKATADDGFCHHGAKMKGGEK